jgi:hypothetical protein
MQVRGPRFAVGQASKGHMLLLQNLRQVQLRDLLKAAHPAKPAYLDADNRRFRGGHKISKLQVSDQKIFEGLFPCHTGNFRGLAQNDDGQIFLQVSGAIGPVVYQQRNSWICHHIDIFPRLAQSHKIESGQILGAGKSHQAQ